MLIWNGPPCGTVLISLIITMESNRCLKTFVLSRQWHLPHSLVMDTEATDMEVMATGGHGHGHHGHGGYGHGGHGGHGHGHGHGHGNWNHGHWNYGHWH